MITYRNALSIVEELAIKRKIFSEEIDLNNSIGRILAKSITSPEEVPSFTNSAMDGFAVFSADTLGATKSEPIEIPVDGLIAAGDIDAFQRACSQGSRSAIEIMTGAPVPTRGYDAVVRVEDVQVQRSIEGHAQSIRLTCPLKPGENIRLKGTDYSLGQVVLKQGVRISPEHVLACASLGVTRLSVKKKPRIAVVSTGSELVAPETPTLDRGMIRNSTGPFLVAALRNFGADAHYLGVVADDPSLYRRTIERALEDGAEVIISTGAVSMGKYDFVPQVLQEMEAKTYFHKAAIRPGKPVLFAEFEKSKSGCVFFGVPGNPVSTAVGLRFFVEPYLRAALGLSRELPLKAKLSRDCQKPAGLRCFFKGRAQVGNTGLDVEALKGQASYVVSALVEANCWVVLSEEATQVAASAEVEIYPLQNSFEKGIIQ